MFLFKYWIWHGCLGHGLFNAALNDTYRTIYAWYMKCLEVMPTFDFGNETHCRWYHTMETYMIASVTGKYHRILLDWEGDRVLFTPLVDSWYAASVKIKISSKAWEYPTNVEQNVRKCVQIGNVYQLKAILRDKPKCCSMSQDIWTKLQTKFGTAVKQYFYS